MKYLDYYIEHEIVETEDGHQIKVLELKLPEDDTVLNEWSEHLREHYCSIDEIDMLRNGIGCSREEYLTTIKFPDENESLGPATRSGDFAEILVADYIEFIEGYFIPRTRYDRKITRNSSSQGSDLIAFKMGEVSTSDDELVIYEVKAQAANSAPQKRLQDAIYDSRKDIKRLGESLNAINQRLIDKGEFKEAEKIQRFQNRTDRPYILQFGAAAVHATFSYSKSKLEECVVDNDDTIKLLVIYSEDLMLRIHDIYRRAARC